MAAPAIGWDGAQYRVEFAGCTSKLGLFAPLTSEVASGKIVISPTRACAQEPQGLAE